MSKDALDSRKNEILNIIQSEHNGKSDSDIALLNRIITASLKLDVTKNLESQVLAEKVWDVKSKYVEFFSNISLNPIYTISDDRKAKEEIEKIRDFLDNRKDKPLTENTMNFKDNRSDVIGEAIHEDPDIIDVMRYITGMGNITFELLASGWLHRENFFRGIIRSHSISEIKNLVGNDILASKSLSRNFESLGLSPKLSMIEKLTDQERAELVDMLAEYQMRGHIAKISGHKAEMLTAKHLEQKKIPFEPKEKLTTLGASDIAIPQIRTSRLFDIAIPNTNNPKIVIESAYYNSNTGSVASKVVRELEGTKKLIESSQSKTVQNIKLVGFLDGAGWIAMSGHLIKMLLILDDFIQLNTIGKLEKYLKDV